MQEDSSFVEEGQTESMESDQITEDQDFDSQDMDQTSEEEFDNSETDDSSNSNEDDSETELTEKGTKLDQNPMSALNQQLANERARLKQYEAFLNDPEAVEQYLGELRQETGRSTKQQQQPAKEAPKKPDRLDSKEDLEQYHAYLEHKAQELETKIDQVDQNQRKMVDSTRAETIANRISDDINKTLSKHPVLDPQSKDFDPELSDRVAELYEIADFDRRSGAFRGRVTFSSIAEKVMRATKSAEKRGSQKAQTLVVDRSKGRTISGSSKAQVDESNMTPSQIIASRMKRISAGRK